MSCKIAFTAGCGELSHIVKSCMINRVIYDFIKADSLCDHVTRFCKLEVFYVILKTFRRNRKLDEGFKDKNVCGTPQCYQLEVSEFIF